MSQKITYNVTSQSLVWDCPEGRPSSVTSVTVYPAETGDDGTSESATTGSAAIETNPDTTFDAASGDGQADARVCNLTATTGCTVGRRYLATNSTGEKEWIEVREVSSGASVTARNPLANAYAAADTFESTRISIGIDDTWVADESNVSDDLDPNPGYRVRWVYVVNSVTYVHDEYFDLVRYTADHDVRGIDVDAVSPGWLDRLPIRHREDQGQRILDEAYEELAFDLHKHDVPVEMVRNKSVIRRLVIRRAIMALQQIALDQGRAEVGLALEDGRKEYESLLQGLITVVNRTAMATTSEGGSTKVAAVSLMEK